MGWVYAGLARILSLLRRMSASRAYYQDLFVKMSGKIVALQKPDGSWAPPPCSIPRPARRPNQRNRIFHLRPGLGCSCRNFERSGLPARGGTRLVAAWQGGPTRWQAGLGPASRQPARYGWSRPYPAFWRGRFPAGGLGHIRSCRQALSGSSLWRTRPVTGESSRPFRNRFDDPNLRAG